MRKVSLVLTLLCSVALSAVSEDSAAPEVAPSLHGTINVVVANDRGIVALTDSMLTQISQNEKGVRTSRKLSTAGQKLFRLDDRTVCTFADFASTETRHLPRFLNNTSAIIGRYEDKMKGSRPLLVSEKLEELEDLFTYYLTGVANLVGQGNSFELLIAGYDPDGTPEVGRLVLRTTLVQTAAGPFLRSVTQQRSVFPILHREVICLNGIVDVAVKTLSDSRSWMGIPEVVGCKENTGNQAMDFPIEQMSALARSIKLHTQEIHKEGGRQDADRGSYQGSSPAGGAAQIPPNPTFWL
jgi:hypothetical protein